MKGNSLNNDGKEANVDVRLQVAKGHGLVSTLWG